MIRDLAWRGAVLAATVGVAGVAVGLAVRADAGPGTVTLLLGLAALASVVVGWMTFRNAEATVREIAAASTRLAEGELWERVPATSGATVELVRHFNHMASRVQELVRTIEADQARLQSVFDAATDAMIAVSADTSVRLINLAALRLIGTSRDEAVGRALIESVRDYELDAMVRQAVQGGEAPAATVVTFGPKRLSLKAAAVPIKGGGDWAVLLMLTDLSEVQRLDQVRRDFVANVSHELRTPVASIRALVETMEDGNVEGEEAMAAFLVRIRQQAERMTSLVNELLDLSRIESGAIELHPEPMALAEVAREAASLMRPRLDARGLEVAIEGPTGVTVEADRSSVLRMFTNLLDNAAKFGPPGSTVHVEVRDEGSLAAVCVTDEGPGISEQDRSRVFERFFKAESAAGGSGSGLGLAIVKHLVRAHGGTVDAASQPGEGAVFTVRLPKRFTGVRSGRAG